MVVAWLERYVSCATPRSVPSSPEGVHLCMRHASLGVVPLPHNLQAAATLLIAGLVSLQGQICVSSLRAASLTLPSLTITHPTAGLGNVCPKPFLA